MDAKNSLQQFRNLLTDYADVIAAHTPEGMAVVRGDAGRRLIEDQGLRFPPKGSDGYEYTDLNAMFEADLGVNLSRVPVTMPVDNIFRCTLPAVSPLLGITVNDTFRPTDRLVRLLPEGVTVTAFSAANAEQQSIIAKYYGKICEYADDTAALMNTALAQDGILIHVGAGVKVERPIQLVNILKPMEAPDGRSLPVLAVRRLLVVLEDNAEIKILVCDHDIARDTLSASSRVNELVVGPGARLSLYELEETTSGTARFCRTVCRQARDSEAALFTGTLQPGRTRNEVEVHLDGPGAELEIDGMAVVDNGQTGDNSAVVRHHAARCRSEQTFKYLVDRQGRGAFEGLICVDEGAVATEAFQNNRNMIADEGCRMHARPQLEIYCDDVKCSHGSATGQLDERALFYMRSRGIPETEARTMLMNAFMADVIDSVRLEPLRDRLRHIVERRLAGDNVHCQSCPLE